MSGNSNPQAAQRIFRMRDLPEVTGLKRTRIQKLMEIGEFPKPFKITGGRAIGWFESQIAEWQRNVIDRATKPATKRRA